MFGWLVACHMMVGVVGATPFASCQSTPYQGAVVDACMTFLEATEAERLDRWIIILPPVRSSES